MTTDYLLVDISLSAILSVVMVNDYSDFQHNYFGLTEKSRVGSGRAVGPGDDQYAGRAAGCGLRAAGCGLRAAG